MNLYDHVHILQYFTLLIFLPLLGSLILTLKKFSERGIWIVSYSSLIIPLIPILLLTKLFITKGVFEYSLLDFNLANHRYQIHFLIDHASILMLYLAWPMTNLIGKFSFEYLHKELNIQSFYQIILLFTAGLYAMFLSGNFLTLFIGWELVGLSSFLLIGFYRNRIRALLNSLRVFYIYRIFDIGLIIAAIYSHHLFHENDLFSNFYNITGDSPLIYVLSICIVLASIGKSAQFPVLTWPARAMEGPTPSSAIFYGALSIHAGVFLLYRSADLWHSLVLVRICIGVLGFTSFIIASGIGRIQTTIKGQIAFASVAQIGIMFIELAFGQKELVLIHLFLHSFLRCYQILVSPSILMLKLMDRSSPKPNKSSKSIEDLGPLPEKFKVSLYSLLMQENFLDVSGRILSLFHIHRIKSWFQKFADSKWPIYSLTTTILILILHKFSSELHLNHVHLALISSIFSLYLVLLSLLTRSSIGRSFLFFIFGMFMALYSTYFIPSLKEITRIYSYWIFTAAILGGISIWKIRKNHLFTIENNHILKIQRTLFFLFFIIIANFPLSLTFFLEDGILSHLIDINIVLMFAIGLVFMLSGIVTSRIFVKAYSLNKDPFI